jgi:hypothetical protein
MGMDVYGKSGNYFRANVWSWRPIHVLCYDLNQKYALNLDLSGWSMNDGAGLHNQADCDALADAIEAHVADGPEEYTADCGMYCDAQTGRFVPAGTEGAKTAHYTDKEHVLEFAKFLRECGGSFEIC